jgi:NSS family neurotransmitter:Na+ symporter
LERQLFSSRLSSILTLLGVAIGLGNVWRFPYMMGRYGGSAFLAVYLVLTLFFAFPALMAEMTLGRMSGKGTIDAFRLGFGKGWGTFFGFSLMIVITIAGSYYAVVVANVLFTALFSIISGFSPGTIPEFHSQLSNGWLQYTLTIFLIASSLYIIHKGLVAGIERISKIVMPLFFLALVYMIVHSLTLPSAIEKCVQFLHPDFSLLGPSEVFAALGQAFFSVGLGGTFVVVYASFVKKDENISRIAIFTGFGDASASLLISLFLVPAILVLGMNMASGPGLIFDTFPMLFASMPGGRTVGSLFLVSIFIVAYLSLVAAYQVPFTCLRNERTAIPRRQILIVIGITQALLALPSSLFPTIIGTLDLVFGSGMQVLGSALCVVALSWGMRRDVVLQEMFRTQHPGPLQLAIFYWIKWLIPLSLLAVLTLYIYDTAF